MRFYVLLCLLIVFAQQMYADTLTIYNHARYPVYVSLYCVETNIWQTSIGPATRQSPVVEIAARSHGTLERSSFAFLLNREIIFSANSKDLAAKLDSNEYKKAAVHPAGFTHGATYHIAEHEKTLHCYSEVEWYVTKPIIDAADDVIDTMLIELQETYSNCPYAHTNAQIRMTNNLCQQEIEATAKRIANVHSALESSLTMTIAMQATPRIALCLSGIL